MQVIIKSKAIYFNLSEQNSTGFSTPFYISQNTNTALLKVLFCSPQQPVNITQKSKWTIYSWICNKSSHSEIYSRTVREFPCHTSWKFPFFLFRKEKLADWILLPRWLTEENETIENLNSILRACIKQWFLTFFPTSLDIVTKCL